MKVAVIGANGQLGTDVCGVLRSDGMDVVEINHDACDIADLDAVRSTLGGVRPDVVVNTAAFHQLDQCEAEPQKAFAVNALGARHVAVASQDLGAYLIHVSTDYVFDGKKAAPYVEEDPACPLNVYGVTKLAGEHFVQSASDNALVLRTSGLYGKAPCRAKGRNFVELMLKLARERDEIRVVDSEILTPTSTLEVARQILALARSPVVGLCHGTAEGSCSWHAFAAEIFKLAKVNVRLSIAGPDEFPAKVPRPSYSVLENQLLKNHHANEFQDWQAGLREYLGV